MPPVGEIISLPYKVSTGQFLKFVIYYTIQLSKEGGVAF